VVQHEIVLAELSKMLADLRPRWSGLGVERREFQLRPLHVGVKETEAREVDGAFPRKTWSSSNSKLTRNRSMISGSAPVSISRRTASPLRRL